MFSTQLTEIGFPSGYEYLKHHGIISDSACNNTFQGEESSVSASCP